MTVAELRVILDHIPSDMVVAVNESRNEATGFVRRVVVCEGHEDVPYDKADDLYRRGNKAIKNGETKICIIET